MNQSEAQAILGLPDLERAHTLKRLVSKLGRQSDVAKALGVNQGKISTYLSILKLCDKVHELMDPSLPEGERLYLTAACFLTNRDEHIQLVAIKGLRKAASPKEQIAQLRKNIKDYQEARRMSRVITFAPPVPVVKEVPQEPAAAKSKTVPAQKPSPQPELPQPPLPRLSPWRQSPKPTKAALPKVVLRPTFERAASPQSSFVRPQKSDQVASFNLSDLLIEYWDGEKLFRYVSEKYDPDRYAVLWRKKLLMFQHKGTPRPERYPDLDAPTT